MRSYLSAPRILRAATDVSFPDDSAAALLRMVFEEHLADLPVSNREIVRLRVEGYEVSEIADRTGRARRTIERVLQDFRRRLTRS